MAKKQQSKGKNVGSRLTALRLHLRKTQEEMGKMFSRQKSSFGKYERMENDPPYDVLYRLAMDYDVSLDYLICGRGTLFYGESQLEGQKDRDESSELLYLMEKVPLVRHAVMNFFQRFKIENREIINKELAAAGEKE